MTLAAKPGRASRPRASRGDLRWIAKRNMFDGVGGAESGGVAARTTQAGDERGDEHGFDAGSNPELARDDLREEKRRAPHAEKNDEGERCPGAQPWAHHQPVPGGGDGQREIH